jgi:hypothetical protein
MRRSLIVIVVAVFFGGFQSGASLQTAIAELAAPPTIEIDQLCLRSETTPVKRGCCSHHFFGDARSRSQRRANRQGHSHITSRASLSLRISAKR